MDICEFCNTKFSREADVLRHQSSKGTRCYADSLEDEQRRLASLRARVEDAEDDDGDYGENDPFAAVYSPSFNVNDLAPWPSEIDDTRGSDSPPRRVAIPLQSAASTGSSEAEAERNGVPTEPDDNDSWVDQFKGGGKIVGTDTPPLAKLYGDTVNLPDHPFGPFGSEAEWMFVQWAKRHKVKNSAVDELLKIRDMFDTPQPFSFKNAAGMNAIIDSMPVQAAFQHKTLQVDGFTASYDLFYCDALEVICELVGDPTFEGHQTWIPERIYEDEGRTRRLTSELSNADWMWTMQAEVLKVQDGATVIPVIIGSDKTQLTAFSGNHSAYPIYLSIGNIDKHMRRQSSTRALRLIGYLPTLSPDESLMSEARARTLRMRHFHQSMRIVFSNVFKAAQTGVPMTDSKGDIRICFPLLASYIADYPEQCLITCIRYGQTCPKCDIRLDDFGSHKLGTPRTALTTHTTLSMAQTAPTAEKRDEILKTAGTNLVIPFWLSWPRANMHLSVTVDDLHALKQGLTKHLITWILTIVGKDETDARMMRMPLAHGLRHFASGISGLSRITGGERKAIQAQMIAVIHGRVSRDAVRATRALINFVMTSSYKCHSEATRAEMRKALDEFHRYKAAFKKEIPDLDFNFPKMHILEHWDECIRLFGTSDNYDSQDTERAHIVQAKDAFDATNHRDYTVQMCTFNQRNLKIHQFGVYLAWRHGRKHEGRIRPQRKPPTGPVVFAKRPPAKLCAKELQELHLSSHELKPIFHGFLEKWHNSGQVAGRGWYIQQALQPDILLALDHLVSTTERLNLWYRVKFYTPNMQSFHAPDVLDIAHATGNRQTNSFRGHITARFDTVLVETKGDGVAGIGNLKDIQIARLRAIITPPAHLLHRLFGPKPPAHLAVVEWFTKPTRRDPDTHMFRVKREPHGKFGIVEAIDLRRSCHLLPEFGRGDVDKTITPFSVLDKCDSFLLNDLVDSDAFTSMYL